LQISFKALWGAVLFLLCSCTGAWAQASVRIGVLSFESHADTVSRWRPTASYLQASIPRQKFEIVPLNYEELNTAVEHGQLDFVLTNPEHYVVLRNVFRISPMVTLNTRVGNQALSSMGGVIFTRADNLGLEQLQDVKGRRVAAVGLYSLGGFLAAADVFRQQHIDLKSGDVAALNFTGLPHSKVVESVMGGQADVGLVRTGVLEQMARQGKLDLAQVRILNAQTGRGFPQQLSTELYPEWPFAAMPQVPADLLKAVALALLSIPQDSSFAHAGNYAGFTPPANYAPVEELMRRLKVYPNVASTPLWQELWLSYTDEMEWTVFALFVLADRLVCRVAGAPGRHGGGL
jgi:ABC-type phosphate/phosphonate transport system substrate-binding protein